MKRCRKCWLIKPDSEFYARNVDSKDGLNSYCKKCQDRITANGIASNKSGYLAYRREYRSRPEVKEQRAAYQRMYRLRKKRKLAG